MLSKVRVFGAFRYKIWNTEYKLRSGHGLHCLTQIRQPINRIQFKQLSMQLNSMISKMVEFYWLKLIKKGKKKQKKNVNGNQIKSDLIEL